jgi:Sulfotransferase family
MSIFKNRISHGLARVKKVLVNRVNTSPPERADREARQSDREVSQTNREARQELRKANRKLARQERELAALRAMLAKRVAGGGRAGDDRRPGGAIRAENVVWVFGSGRTGSSWLTFMMGSLPDHTRWNEPRVGYLFGDLYHRVWTRQDTKHFILGDDYEEFWLGSARGLVLDGGTARFPERAEGGYLVIKEPHGSMGAPLLMKALPESRMIFLVRDPRAVMASSLDAHKKGSRPSKRRIAKRPELFEKDTEADEQPNAFIEAQAKNYLRDIELSKQAYDAHEGRKVLVRYEDLRADTLGTMQRIYSSLEIPVDEADLVRAIETYAWENIPEEEKGPGKIRRRASSEGWREDLTPEQIAIVEEEAAPILDQFYPEYR